jgi:putative glutamine amidotransferase
VSRPVIGITIGYEDRREGVHLLRADYLRSVEQGGGLSVVLAPGRPEDAGELLDRLDALLLSGGSDVDPVLYGELPHPKLGKVIRERDDFELALCREALARDLPILAICRGHQVLNVATGGTLIQDIPSESMGDVDHNHDARRERWERAHDVRILDGTRLRHLLHKETLAVNSFHHQAIGDLGRGLVASAFSREDRVIEAVEIPECRFVLGVQWHPESFWSQPDGFQPLFRGFVEAARR